MESTRTTGVRAAFAISPVSHGETIPVGHATIRVHHNCGHKLGSVWNLVGDAEALTGDFLFIASIGRPDLAGKTAEWTALLWQSVERVRREWPAPMIIYPAHYGDDVGAEPRPVRRGTAIGAAGREPVAATRGRRRFCGLGRQPRR